MITKSNTLAYVVGVALGDGNLSNPNGRATRLRITCDITYPNIINEITNALREVFPNNKVSICKIKKGTCIDISVYTNELNEVMPWKVKQGSKYVQNAHVPEWVFKRKTYTKHCLRGLLQTDGSIYTDRGYLMVNFTNLTKSLIDDVYQMICSLDYQPHKYKSLQKNGNVKHVVRISKNVSGFINEIKLTKN